MRVTIYAHGNVTNQEDMQRLAQTLERVAEAVRQGKTADPSNEGADFFVEDDETDDDETDIDPESE